MAFSHGMVLLCRIKSWSGPGPVHDLVQARSSYPTHPPTLQVILCAEKGATMKGYCTPKLLPKHLQTAAARQAVNVNPLNAPSATALFAASPGVLTDEPVAEARLAVLVKKYWGAGGVRLTVSFMENVAANLRARILEHMNAWNFANVAFTPVSYGGDVRITLRGQGYWSYIGTDVRMIPKNQPTMSLQNFTMNTPEEEYLRVVRHETGHTLGFPHEHMRQEIISLLDMEKTIAYGRQAWGWSRQQVIEQVLTPIPEDALIGTEHADELSIMAYQFPGQCTKNG